MWFKYPYTSYSELNLDWFLEQFKKLKDEWDTTSGEWDQMQLDFQTLEGTVQTFTTFVTQYFDNLDVQQEINNKLDALVADGTLSTLLAPLVDDKLPGVVDDKLGAVVTDQLPGVVTDQLPGVVSDQIGEAVATPAATATTAWLTANVDPVGSAVTIDTSLTIAGSAADAKVTGDKVRPLEDLYNNAEFTSVTASDFNTFSYNLKENHYYTFTNTSESGIIGAIVSNNNGGTNHTLKGTTPYISAGQSFTVQSLYNDNTLLIYFAAAGMTVTITDDTAKVTALEKQVNDISDALDETLDFVSANVYDNNMTAGYVNPQTGAVNTTSTTTKMTDMLPVLPGKYLVSAYNGARNEMFLLATYDADQQFVAEAGQYTGDGYQRSTGYFLIPDNVYYVIVSYVNEDVHADNKLWLLDAVNYNPSSTYIKSLILDNGNDLPFSVIVDKPYLANYVEDNFHISHKYYGKKIVAMGDSVTNGQAWFDGAAAYFGSRPVNKGVPGSTISTVGSDGFCTDARVNDIPLDTDVLLIMGGINDWISNVPLGDKDLSNVDTNTLYGAVNVLIQKLYARIPSAKIICMGSTFGMYPNRPGFTDTTGVYNNLDLCTLDYGKAFADMAQLNGVESFVIGYSCGWNKDNISTYIDNDGAYLHPNATGGARMAEVIADNIK